MNETDQKIQETLKRQQLEDQASLHAAATPLPGPMRDVFAAQPNIIVGKYSVRPFYDLDFEFLQALEHPFANFAVGDTRELNSFAPRGPKAWQLFHLLTQPVDAVEFQLANQPVEDFKKAAREEFSRYQLGGLFSIYQAVVQQLVTYSSAVVGFAPNSDEESKEGEKPSPPSLAPSTARVG
jgi:hypothetical protein